MSVEITTQLPAIPERDPETHKGTYGHVLVVAGSRGMSGAAILAGTGALRGGAGLVTVATPESIQPVVSVGHPCYMTQSVPMDDQGQIAGTPAGETTVLNAASRCSVVAVGPGLGQGPGVLRAVLALITRSGKPCVVDADGLNVLARMPDVLRRRDPLIITPHPGEFARLVGASTISSGEEREALATRFAAERNLLLVLKGRHTLVTDGKRLYRNTTGNAGMATGGSGDVLTGLIAALWAQGYEAFEAAQLGVHAHGLAGDLARDDLTEICLTAADVLAYLPRAFRTLTAR